MSWCNLNLSMKTAAKMRALTEAFLCTYNVASDIMWLWIGSGYICTMCFARTHKTSNQKIFSSTAKKSMDLLKKGANDERFHDRKIIKKCI